LRPLADRWFLVQINNHWPYLCEFARGEATGFDPLIEACAQRVIAAVRANEADEVIVIGHSGGGAMAPAVIVRALELDPDIGRRGPPLVLLTLGSIAPGAALDPRAQSLRATFARPAAGRDLGQASRRRAGELCGGRQPADERRELAQCEPSPLKYIIAHTSPRLISAPAAQSPLAAAASPSSCPWRDRLRPIPESRSPRPQARRPCTSGAARRSSSGAAR